MSKYRPLSEHLTGRPEPEWRASFAELEAVLGFPLPKSARGGGGWWSNDSERPHVRAWTMAGWEVAEVDPDAEAVVFRRPVSEAALQNPLVREDEDIGPEVSPQSETSREIRPRRIGLAPRRARGWGLAAAIAAGAAVTAGVGALVVRGMLRRPPAGNT